MKLLGNIGLLFAVGLLAALPGCRRIAIADDFRAPYEKESLLMAQTTRSYMVAGPPGVRVDVGLDFEYSGSKADRLLLEVGEADQKRLGLHVPGSQVSQAVCGVELSYGGVPVEIQNLNSLRSAPFALRIERSPSRFCQPQRVIPSSALARR